MTANKIKKKEWGIVRTMIDSIWLLPNNREGSQVFADVVVTFPLGSSWMEALTMCMVWDCCQTTIQIGLCYFPVKLLLQPLCNETCYLTSVPKCVQDCLYCPAGWKRREGLARIHIGRYPKLCEHSVLFPQFPQGWIRIPVWQLLLLYSSGIPALPWSFLVYRRL